jgi:hypothetical protein
MQDMCRRLMIEKFIANNRGMIDSKGKFKAYALYFRSMINRQVEWIDLTTIQKV